MDGLQEQLSAGARYILDLAGAFFDWLNIRPSGQDVVKAFILIAFVPAILMIVGDVYRGEIQNKLHRILLVPAERNHPPLLAERHLSAIRRKARRERDISFGVHQTIVGLPLNNIFSNVLFYVRYRDFLGRLRLKKIETYRVKFKVRVRGFGAAQSALRKDDHQYTDDEKDVLVNEEEAQVVTMAGSRVDYIYEGLIDRLKQNLASDFENRKHSWWRRLFASKSLSKLRQPEVIGMLVRFHFPINPYFLLYRHPDTNVRTTAWLTVLTSVFALLMQLIYSGGPLGRDRSIASGGGVETSDSTLDALGQPRSPARPPSSAPMN